MSCNCCKKDDKHCHSHGGADVHSHGHSHDHSHSHEHGEEERLSALNIVIFAISAVIFAVCLTLKLTGNTGVIIPIGFVVSAVLAGYDIAVETVKSIIKGDIFNENLLMCVAAIGAICVGEFPEAAAVMLLYKIGEFAEDKAVDSSEKSIKKLMDIRPEFARRINGSDYETVPPEEVAVGDTIEVRAGEKIPLDGVVISGSADLNTAALTGESAPRFAAAGDDVMSGSICTNGTLRISVSKEYSSSVVSLILKMVEQAEKDKPKTERFITRFARVYTPLVMLLALLVAVVPPIVLGGGFKNWVSNALVLLVVSCPCSLVISVPLGYLCGMGASSKNGVLIKNGTVLDDLCKVNTAVFDKTGTLTKGRFEIIGLYPADGYTSDQLKNLAAIGESTSTHPIAKAISVAGDEVDLELVTNAKEYAGKGVSVVYDKNTEIIAGNAELMRDSGVEFTENNEFGTKIYVAENGKFVGCVLLADTVRDETVPALRELKSVGIEKTVMLTGDNKVCALEVADKVGIDKFHAGLLPADKVEYVTKYRKSETKGKKVLFVGDGINDAPVITAADVGVAMGGIGSDAAVEAADVVIMTDDLKKLPKTIALARKTKMAITENIIFSLAFKVAIIALGYLGIASMWMAVFSDVGVCLLTILNSLRVFYSAREK